MCKLHGFAANLAEKINKCATQVGFTPTSMWTVTKQVCDLFMYCRWLRLNGSFVKVAVSHGRRNTASYSSPLRQNIKGDSMKYESILRKSLIAFGWLVNGLLFKVGNDVKSQAHTLFVELLSLIYCFLFTLSVSVDYISPKESTVNYLWEWVELHK